MQSQLTSETAVGTGELVARFAAGEPGGVAEVYRAYGRQVYAVSHQVLGDAGLADEATKRTFLQAWRLADNLEADDDLGPLLANIATRTATDLRRISRSRRAAGDANGARPTDAIAETRSAGRHVGGQPDSSWRLRGALDALPVQERDLIRLEHQQRLTPPEVAQRLAIPLSAVNALSQRAHRRLAGLLRRESPQTH